MALLRRGIIATRFVPPRFLQRFLSHRTSTKTESGVNLPAVLQRCRRGRRTL